MAKIGRPGLPESERRRVWDLWKQGTSFSEIGRIVGVGPGSVFSILKPRGGISFPEPTTRAGTLTLAEREEISRGIAAGKSIRAIASTLGRAASTISREITRNKDRGKYRAIDAHDRAMRAARRPQELKLQQHPGLRAYVERGLRRYWSPEQIAGRLARDFPDDGHMRISHEAIYRCVYLNSTRKVLPHRIHDCLRRHRPLRYSKYHTTRGQWRSQIKGARPISERPQAAAKRAVPGHWEGDLLLGGRTSQVATLVDRRTRKVAVVKLPERTATEVRIELGKYLTRRPHIRMNTLTWDRGMELAEHHQLTKDTGVEVFFAAPRSPWERGTNENTNGLLRQYLPKKTNLARYSQHELDQIAHQLNTRPRKTLGYRTPLEAEHEAVALTL